MATVRESQSTTRDPATRATTEEKPTRFRMPDTRVAERDFTEPRHAADADRADRWAMIASVATGLAVIAGVWLIVSRLVYNYVAAGAGSSGRFNGVVIGIAVAFIAVVRLATLTSSRMLGLVTAVLGGWMIGAPWLFGYARWSSGSPPPWSDVLTGGAIALFGLVSWMAASRRASLVGRTD